MTVRSASQVVPVAQRAALILRELARIVVGKDDVLRLALTCMIARGHLLIEDIPGVGKSTLAQALAATLGLKYARVQFTSDLLPADVLGLDVGDFAIVADGSGLLQAADPAAVTTAPCGMCAISIQLDVNGLPPGMTIYNQAVIISATAPAPPNTLFHLTDMEILNT